MKKGSSILLFLASGVIILLLGLAAYLTIYITDDPADDSSKAAQMDPLNPENIPGATHTLSLAGSDSKTCEDPDFEEAEHYFLFVGDSRTVGMRNAVNKGNSHDSCTYIAKEGEGYRWFYNEGISQLEDVLAKTPDITVILNLGVNDLNEIRQYISLYNILFDAYPQTSFYILSVNPVEEGLCDNITNAEIQTFNDEMRTAFPEHYLDSFSYLLSDDFQTADGLHYTENMYCSIHHFVVMMLTAK